MVNGSFLQEAAVSFQPWGFSGHCPHKSNCSCQESETSFEGGLGSGEEPAPISKLGEMCSAPAPVPIPVPVLSRPCSLLNTSLGQNV